MKKLYVAIVLLCSAHLSLAQTDPLAQSLPFQFTSLTGGTLPGGLAVHRFGTSAAAIPTTRTTLPGSGDLPYISNPTSGGWKDEGANGLSLLASGSQSAGALIVAINTTGLTNVQVAWTCRTILQQASRDNSIALQYRVGTSGNFIDAGTTSTYTSQGKTAGDAASFTETLPSGAENQAVVQVRWIYWESNGSAGSRDRIAVDDVTISGNTSGGDVTPPTVSSLSPADNATGVAITATATLTFSETVQKVAGNVYVRRISDNVAVQTLDVTTTDVIVSGAQVSFALNLLNSTAYYVEVDGAAFEDIAGNDFGGISGPTAWNFTTVAPPAAGILGNVYTFNTCSNYVNEGFTTYSVTGPQVWSCTKFGRTYTTDPSADSAIEMNGFASGNQINEDWLISPKFDLTGTAFPLLNFYSINRFAGPSLSLRVSTNYSGTGNPTAATWTVINGKFPPDNANVWTISDSVNLSAFKSANTYIAWVYNSTASAASRWTLDDITVYNSTVAPAASLTVNGTLLDFHTVAAGASSVTKALTFYGNNVTSDLTVTAPAGFEVSKNNAGFASSVTYTSAELGVTLATVYVRFTPPMGNTGYGGYLRFTSTGISRDAVYVKGNSQNAATTLNVVNWNIEWFGSTGNGPSDETLQQANAKKVMDYLDADVYAVAEIVSAASFGSLVNSLAAPYSYVIGEYCSGGTTAGACASSQKLALAYKTGVMSNVTARPLLISSPAAITNWASGRVPFLVTGNVNKNGQTTVVNFIVLHAKANTGNTQDQIDSYFERKAGVQELKDTLDTYFPNANVIILGDFNDDLDRTIAPTTGADTVSSYQSLVADSTDGNSYRSLTLPLSNFKLSSTTGNPEVIDHVVISNEMAPRYLIPFASLYNDIDVLANIANYAGTTSDHYPVLTRFNFGGVLPVRLTSFSASKQGSGVRVQWTTSQELNTKEFVVERSTDGIRFQKLTTVAATGSSSVVRSYQTLDAQPAPGNNYYRLKTVDVNGAAELSSVVKINIGKSFTVSLSPNPASQTLVISLANNREPVQMELLDMNGKLVQRTVLQSQQNPVSVAGLSKGLYLIRLRTAAAVYTEKLVVE